MKRNIFLIVLFSIIILGSCKKDYVETNRDAYDWDAIVPEILGFNGPTTVYASGLLPSEYSVDARGGSSFVWKIEGSGGVITADDENYLANILWDQVDVTTPAMVIVTETTVAGITTEPDTLFCNIYQFCALPNGIDDLMGTFIGEGGWGPQEYIFVKNTATEFTASGFFYAIFEDWGTRTDGGTCTSTFNPNGPALKIPYQYYYTNDEGGTDGDWVYWIEGEGSWTNCGSVPHIDYGYSIEWHDPADGSAGWMSGGAIYPASIDISAAKAGVPVNIVNVSKEEMMK